MANLGDGGFDARAVEPNQGFDVLPAGEYDVAIVSSEVKATSDNNGKYLKLELQVLNGQFQNRKIWDNLNIWNQNAQAVQIAKGTLSAICRAVNVLTPQDSAELHNKPLRIKVAVKKDPEYGDKNVVKAYKSREVQPGPAAPPAAGQPELAAAGSVAGQPW
jgi:hypothetical protein